MFGKIKRLIRLFNTINVLKTIYLNYKVFPRKIARKLPVYVGKNVDIHEIHKGSIEIQNGIIIRSGMISIGICHYPMISNKGLYTLIRISPHGKLVLGDNTFIYSGCSIIVTYNGLASIGSDFVMNQNSRIYCANSVTIGEHCRIGWETQIYDSNFHFLYDSLHHCIGNALGKVFLGNNVWIGCRCTISKGSLIPKYAIISSNSFVAKELKNEVGGGIWAGIPVSLKKEGFFRILDNGMQRELFSHFGGQGANDKTKDISLSREQLKRSLNQN